MKSILRLFNFVKAYNRAKRRYEKNGKTAKIFGIVVSAGLIALTVFLEWSAIKVFKATSNESWLHVFAWLGGVILAAIALDIALIVILRLTGYIVTSFSSSARSDAEIYEKSNNYERAQLKRAKESKGFSIAMGIINSILICVLVAGIIVTASIMIP